MKNRISELLNKNGIDLNKELFGLYWWEEYGRLSVRARIKDLDDVCKCLDECVGGCDDDLEGAMASIEEYSDRPYDMNGNVMDVKVWMFTIDGVVVAVTDDESEWYKYCARELDNIRSSYDEEWYDMLLRSKKWLDMLDLK